MGQDGPATAFQAQPGPVPGVAPEVGGLCLVRWFGRRRCPSQLRDSRGQSRGSRMPVSLPGRNHPRAGGGGGNQQLDGTTRCRRGEGGAHSGEGGRAGPNHSERPTGGPAGVPARLNHCGPAGHGDTPGPGRVEDCQGRPPVLAARYLLTRPVPLRQPPE